MRAQCARTYTQNPSLLEIHTHLFREAIDSFHEVLRQPCHEERDHHQPQERGGQLEVRAVLRGIGEQVSVCLELTCVDAIKNAIKNDRMHHLGWIIVVDTGERYERGGRR